MPKIVNSNIRPNFIAKPDMRFATTFLSTKYRDYAVNDEAIMDKITGELFMKRPSDGRIVSFCQNKKYIHDLMLELRVLLTNNEEFNYPKDNPNAYFLSTDYDLVAINNEIPLDIFTKDTIIRYNNSERSYRLSFNISKDSNGFFCRPMTRDSDKIIVEYLTNVYNSFFENYEGYKADFIQESDKFKKDQKWKDSNVILHYHVDIYNDETDEAYRYKDSAYIRFNEERCIILPSGSIYNDFPNGYTRSEVTIESLEYYKMHYVIEHLDDIEAEYKDGSVIEGINKFLANDKRIYVNYLSIMSFVNNSTDINLLGNEFLIALLDIPYIRRYMTKLAKLKTSSEFIVSTHRPSPDDWGANTVWCERIRDVFPDGFVVELPHETDLNRFEATLAKRLPTVLTELTQKYYEHENMLLKNLSRDNYTADEIDHLFSDFNEYMNKKINEKIQTIVDEEDVDTNSNNAYLHVKKVEKGNEVE